MNKEWFIFIAGKQEGPYSVLDLKADHRLTPDTLVWKAGFKDWVKIRYVAELKEIFEDEPRKKPQSPKPSSTGLASSKGISDQQTLTLRQDPPQFFLWLIVAILILLYIFYLFNQPI